MWGWHCNNATPTIRDTPDGWVDKIWTHKHTSAVVILRSSWGVPTALDIVKHPQAESQTNNRTQMELDKWHKLRSDDMTSAWKMTLDRTNSDGTVSSVWGQYYNNATPLTWNTLNRESWWNMNTQVHWHSGYPQRSSWGVPTASDELYRC